MKAEAVARLCRIASGGRGVAVTGLGATDAPPVTPGKPIVTPVTPVTPHLTREVRGVRERVAVVADDGSDPHEVDDRAGMAAGRVPAIYLDAWARLNCQKPFAVEDAEWRLALNDGGLFLDAWGYDAAGMGWTPGALFDVTSGLIWRLGGERVEALGGDHCRLSDGRILDWGPP